MSAIPTKLKPWVEATKRYRLSQMHIVMAMELGLNPKKFGKLVPNAAEQWKSPLPDFIEEIYEKRFKRARPLEIKSFVQMAGKKTESAKSDGS